MWHTTQALTIGFLLAAFVLPGYAQVRRAAPDQAAQQRVEAVIREVYADDYRSLSTSPGRAASLANTLLQSSSENWDPVERYVLLKEASKLAADAASLDICMRAIDLLTQSYDIDAIGIRASMLSTMELRVHQSRLKEYAECAISTGHAAAVEEKFEQAGELAGLALRVAHRIKNTALADRSVALAEYIREARDMLPAVTAAREALRTDSIAPEAAATLGEYIGLYRGDWENAIPLLALGRDSPLKAAAFADLKQPSTPEDCLRIGDTWWELAAAFDGYKQRNVYRRAGHWYARSLPGLSGLERDKVRRRISEIGVVDDLGDSWLSRETIEPRKYEVMSAKYGAPGREIDVTEQVSSMVEKGEFVAIEPGNAFTDVAPNRNKALVISYKYGQETGVLSVDCGQVSTLPVLPRDGLPLGPDNRGFQIVAAQFGAGLRWIDVTPRVRMVVRDPFDRYEFSRDNLARNKDPYPNVYKWFVIWFDYGGRRYARVFKDETTAGLFGDPSEARPTR